jgi:hypothetical protein
MNGSLSHNGPSRANFSPSDPAWRGLPVPGRTTKVLTGVALATLAAAAVAAAVNHRRGQRPDPDEHAHLEELDARLSAAQKPGLGTTPDGMGRLLDGLLRNRGISVGRLRGWVGGVRQGSLNSEQAVAAESDFGSLEREADQSGM